MQQSPCHRNTNGHGLGLPFQPLRARILHQLRQALRSRDSIRTIREFLGQTNVRTTMIYTHVLNKGGHDVRSLTDRL